MAEDRQPIVCIVGPTASGKSELAQDIACALGGEVIGADSMQVYRYMDIGTGKVLPHERRVIHHGIDLVDPDETYSVALYQHYARSTISDVAARGNLPVLAGGTGFYVRAVIDDYKFPTGEQMDNPIRIRYQAFLEQNGAQALWELLNERDSESAALIHPNNAKRVMRALELTHEGVRYADQVRDLANIPQAMPARMLGLSVDPAHLCERIDKRVDAMREAGLVAEVEGLLDRGFRASLTAPAAIGYKEIVAALDGSTSMDEAFEDIKRATRRYAKRQRTWFRRDERIRWIEATDGNAERILGEALAAVTTMNDGREMEGML